MVQDRLLQITTFIILGILFQGCTKQVVDAYAYDFGAIGDGLSDDTYAIQRAINVATANVYLDSKVYLLGSELKLKSGISLVGNGATLKLKKGVKATVIKIVNCRDVKIVDLTIEGQKKDPITKSTTGRDRNLVNCMNSSDITIGNVIFRDHNYTACRFSDVANLVVRNSTFSNIGSRTSRKEFPFYSYDGIFIGGYSVSRNITIENCKFNNIGFSAEESEVPNDGDGIQIQSAIQGSVTDVVIKGNIFSKCSARAIKLQTGDRVAIDNNEFRDGSKGVGMTMVHDLNDIEITSNKFENISYVLSTNHKKIASDILIKGNDVQDCRFFFRGSGGSILAHSTIESNKVSNIGYCFIDAILQNLLIENNTIVGYAMANDKSYHMALLIAGDSKNLQIIDNEIEATKETRTAIYLQSKIRNAKIEGNEFRVLEGANTDRIIVDHSQTVKTSSSNKVKLIDRQE